MLPIFPTHLGSLSLPRSHSTYIMTIPQSTYPSWHLSLCLPITLSTYHPCHLSFSPTYPSWHLFLLSTYHLSCPPFSVPIPLSSYHQYPITHAAYPSVFLSLMAPIPLSAYHPCHLSFSPSYPSWQLFPLSTYHPSCPSFSQPIPLSTYH